MSLVIKFAFFWLLQNLQYWIFASNLKQTSCIDLLKGHGCSLALLVASVSKTN